MKFPQQLESYLDQTLDQIAASPGRKRAMREEMLGHLLERYQLEIDRHGDERGAIESAIHRLGNVEELRRQLQGCVPFLERIWFSTSHQEEPVMIRVLYVVAVGLIIAGNCVHIAQQEQLELAGVVLLSGLIVAHLCRKDNLATRFMGRWWHWLVGAFTFFFGTAIILPALAKIKHDNTLGILQLEFLSVGAVITLVGLGFMFAPLLTRRTQAA
jgi:hypothetical protein